MKRKQFKDKFNILHTGAESPKRFLNLGQPNPWGSRDYLFTDAGNATDFDSLDEAKREADRLRTNGIDVHIIWFDATTWGEVGPWEKLTA